MSESPASGPPTAADPMIKVPIAFPEPLYEWLRSAAFERREPMAALAREALEEYRRRRDPQLDHAR